MQVQASLFVFLAVLVWCPRWTLGQASGDCDPIRFCSDATTERVGEHASDQPTTIADFKNESEIGRDRHWEGLVPEYYKLNLNFTNRTHYEGAVEITVKVVRETSRVMINHHVTNPSVDYPRITIRPQCESTADAAARSRRRSVPPAPGMAMTTRCIEKATFLESERTLILDLRGVRMSTDKKYVVEVPSFHGRSEDTYGRGGAIGLKEATSESDEDMGRYSALTTIFQMRYARTVFPCMDHPALKAKFELCLEHPERVMVASNTLPVGESRSTGVNRKKDCFEPTPIIPTYVFTFSLMENYTIEKVRAADGGGATTIELYAPSGGIQELRWMLNESIPVVQYMEKITGFKFPLKRLAFVAQYPSPFWGVENFGLVTVDGTHMRGKSDLAYTILYHEIVHQWLGNVVTVEDWREICLQEGLTAYFEWKISGERRPQGDLEKKAQSERRNNADARYYDPYALKDFAVTQDIANHCFGRPPFFFHSIAKKEGFETIEKFLAALIKKRPYGTANLDVWDETLDEVSKASNHSMKGYIKGWFLQPGPLYLVSHKASGGDCILVRQKMFTQDDDTPSAPSAARPVPLRVQTFDPSSKTIATVLTSLESRICGLGDNPIYLVDPDANTFTRKAYTADNYRRILQLQKETPTTLSVDQFKEFVSGFCRAFLDNVLPLDEESTSTKPSDWLEIYQLVRNSSVEVGRVCKVCLSSKEENQSPKQSQWMWLRSCPDLRLNQMLGRNYTFGPAS